jgi:hypothetical protein
MIKFRSIFSLIIVGFIIGGCSLFNPEKYEKDSAEDVLFINEFLASNSTVLADEFGEFDDWVEIYNNSDDAIDIGGMYITDDPDDGNPYWIPDSDPELTTIMPGGFLLIWCDRDLDQGILHVNIRLSANGEAIVLIGKDEETVLDYYEFGPQERDISTGRQPDGSDNWINFQIPSPGASNQ